MVITSERHPVLREGARASIGPYKRRLIYIRDGYSCGWCGWHVEPDDPKPGRILQLDHVIPWSAWGSDRSDNLRTLCAPCNEDRSNFIDINPPRLIGVVDACYWCAREENWLPDDLIEVETDQLDHKKAYCGRCGTTSWVPDEGWYL